MNSENMMNLVMIPGEVENLVSEMNDIRTTNPSAQISLAIFPAEYTKEEVLSVFNYLDNDDVFSIVNPCGNHEHYLQTINQVFTTIKGFCEAPLFIVNRDDIDAIDASLTMFLENDRGIIVRTPCSIFPVAKVVTCIYVNKGEDSGYAETKRIRSLIDSAYMSMIGETDVEFTIYIAINPDDLLRGE